MHHHVRVDKCEVASCCFNRDNVCHAQAIQVGDDEPRCDTYSSGGRGKCGFTEYQAEIGACKTASCEFNDKLMCDAPSVKVGWCGDTAECMTYRKR